MWAETRQPVAPWAPPGWSAGPWGPQQAQGRGGRRLRMETMTSGSWNAAWGTSLLIHQWEAPWEQEGEACTHTNTSVNAHSWACACKHRDVYICVPTCAHILRGTRHIPKHAHPHTHAHKHAHRYACVHMHMYSHCVYTDVHAHKCTRAHIHKYVYAQTHIPAKALTHHP